THLRVRPANRTVGGQLKGVTHGGDLGARRGTRRRVRRPTGARHPPSSPKPIGTPGWRDSRQDARSGATGRHVPPPIRTLTVGPGVPPGQPLRRPLRATDTGRGLSPPARAFTDP